MPYLYALLNLSLKKNRQNQGIMIVSGPFANGCPGLNDCTF